MSREVIKAIGAAQLRGWFEVFNGDLYRKRDNLLIRPQFEHHTKEIQTARQLAATLRAGKYVWPGGYPLHFVMGDDQPLCWNCCLSNFKLTARATHLREGEWCVVGCEVNWEDSEIECCHCNKPVESAYGEAKGDK